MSLAQSRQARTRTGLLCLASMLLLASPAIGQQDYVTRYDAFIGYTYLNSPAIGLPEHGYHFQAGVRMRTWYSLGFDYSTGSGSLLLKPKVMPLASQQRIAGQIAALQAAGRLPANYQLIVPAGSTTQTFAAGPQLSYRGFKKLTLFLRPSLGAMYEKATPHPASGDAFATAISNQMAPSGHKTDWTGFYGTGWGVDFELHRHFGLRVQGDLVWDHLFSDVIRNGRSTLRLSIGPCFNFGRNIMQK